MKRGNLKKQIAIMLCIVMSISLFSGFTGFDVYKGLGTAYYSSNIEVYEDVLYQEIIGEHSVNGIEHGHIIKAEIGKNGVFPLVYNGLVRGTSTVGSMISYAEEQGYKVIAAINGDIYDTSSGTPKGLVIHDGNIVTSGYNSERVIVFDDNNKASLEVDELLYQANSTIEYQRESSTYIEVDVPVENIVTVTTEEIDENGETHIVETTETVVSYEKQLQLQPCMETVTEQVTLNIDFVNVPHGEAKGLHLYNSHYSDSTKSNGIYAEAVIEAEDVQLGVNKTIKGIVKSVNKETSNTPITDKTIVLSTALGSKNYELISCLKPDSEIEISVTNPLNNKLSKAKECIGFYYSLVEEGRNVTSGTNINPRSSIGFKRDGGLVIAEIDGRQIGYSRGINLPDLAEFMINLGCEYAFNLDGGGSSVLYVRQPGLDDTAGRVSRPSEGSERKVANAILLVYREEAQSSIEHVNVYPDFQLMMPGSQASFRGVYSNKLYEKVSSSKALSYSTNMRMGQVDNYGVFTAGSETGTTYVEASVDRKTGRNRIEIVDDIVIIPAVKQIICDAGEIKEIGVSAGYGTANVNVPVASSKELFTWSCDSNIGTIDEKGTFTAATGSAKTGKIYISYNGKTEEIQVQVGASIVSFDDTKEHWAEEAIGVLAGIGYLNGMGDNLFAPDAELTRSQFITMLVKITPESTASDNTENPFNSENEPSDNMQVSDEPAGMNFSDVAETDWFYEYVKWGYDNGIVSGMGDGTFAPNAPITREQMAVMLCKYSAFVGYIMPQIKEIPSFTDQELISFWAKDFVFTVAGAGIINGFETGEFLPQGIATRAQAAKVLFEFCKLRGVI